jgi:multiple sugar transport system substrate-binding protein
MAIKKWRHLLLGCLLVLCWGACAPVAPTPTPSSSPTSSIVNPSPKFSGEIAFLTSEDPEGLQGYKDIITAFNKAQPDVKINLNNIPDTNDYLRRLAADFAAKTPPDVFTVNYRRFGQFAIKGVLEPLDGYLAKSVVIKGGDFYPIAFDAFKLRDKQYCIPQNFSSLQIYYNKNLFTAANVPFPNSGWTRADFLAAARALTKDTNGDGKTDQYGVGIAAQIMRVAPFIWARGGELVDDAVRPTKLTLDTGPALEAFKWFVALQTKEHVAPSKTDEASANSQTRFQKGTLAMFFQSRVVTPEFRQTIKGFEWDVAPMPADKSVMTILHSDAYCMASKSNKKDLAWAFMEFANSPEGQKIIAASGRTVPSLKSVAESPAFLDPQALPANSQLYLDSAAYMRRLPVMTTWIEIEDVINQEIRRAFYGDVSVEEAAKAAVQNTATFFQQNLKDLGAQ